MLRANENSYCFLRIYYLASKDRVLANTIFTTYLSVCFYGFNHFMKNLKAVSSLAQSLLQNY